MGCVNETGVKREASGASAGGANGCEIRVIDDFFGMKAGVSGIRRGGLAGCGVR